MLHPIDSKGREGSDGTFVLGTYGKDDGAPAGEYVATVQWFVKLDLRDLDGELAPRNLLPSRYRSIKTSGLNIRIQEGENQLPAINLMR